MKTSCISHPASQPLIIIREWQKDFCKENECQANHNVVAALLSFFEYWHNIKLAQSEKNRQANDIAERHGDHRTRDEKLWQFHSTSELESGIMNIGKKDSIAAALGFLESMEVIKIGKNPNPKYAFDRTRWFLFRPKTLTDWLKSRSSKNRQSRTKNRSRSSGKLSPQAENSKSSFILSKISSEITTETNNVANATFPFPDKKKTNHFINQQGIGLSTGVSASNNGRKNGSRAAARNGFDSKFYFDTELWPIYPSRNGRKNGKKPAFEIYKKKVKSIEVHKQIIAAIKNRLETDERLRSREQWVEPWPDCQRYLRNERWLDETGYNMEARVRAGIEAVRSGKCEVRGAIEYLVNEFGKQVQNEEDFKFLYDDFVRTYLFSWKRLAVEKGFADTEPLRWAANKSVFVKKQLRERRENEMLEMR